MSVRPEDYLPFSQVCRGLPHLRPRITQAALRDLHESAAPEVLVGDRRIPRADLAELFIPIVRDGFNAVAVSPRGAGLLVRLYCAGVLDTGGKVPGTPASELCAYVQGGGPWLDPARSRAESRAAYEARLADPLRLTEREFTARLLDDVFRRHRGRGEGTLVVGGLQVTRSVCKQVTADGRMLFGLQFRWVGEGGEIRELAVTSRHAGIWSQPG